MADARLGQLSPAEREDFEERAAILEFDGGMSRAGAEKYALNIVLKRRRERAAACSSAA
ncbi:MAG: hypothetical protein AB7K73_16035 [Gammaproteobacteria bacterium]